MQRCTCHALLWQEHLQVDAWELTPAAGKPAGHTSGSTTLPSAGCMDNGPTTALLAGTAKHQESLLLSACFRGRQSCTTLLLPRAVWGTSTWGQPDAGMPSQGKISGPCSNLCLSLSSLPLLEGGGTVSWKARREALLLQGFKGEQLVAVKSIPGWAGWHSPPRWQPERSGSSGSPSRQQLRAE